MRDEDNFDPNVNPDPFRYWFHRRCMAYLCLFFGFLLTFVLLGIGIYKPVAMDSLGVVIGWSFGMLSLVLGSYLGTASFDDYLKHKTK